MIVLLILHADGAEAEEASAAGAGATKEAGAIKEDRIITQGEETIQGAKVLIKGEEGISLGAAAVRFLYRICRGKLLGMI